MCIWSLMLTLYLRWMSSLSQCATNSSKFVSGCLEITSTAIFTILSKYSLSAFPFFELRFILLSSKPIYNWKVVFKIWDFFLNANNELWVTVKISYVLVLVGFWQGAAASVFPKVLFDNNVTIKEAINATTIISVYSVSIDFWKRKARVDSNLNHIHCQIIG